MVDIRRLHTEFAKYTNLPISQIAYPHLEFIRMIVGLMDPKFAVELADDGGRGGYYMSSVSSLCDIVIITDVEAFQSVTLNASNDNPKMSFMFCDAIHALTVLNVDVDLLLITHVKPYDRILAEVAAWREHMSSDGLIAVVCADDMFWKTVPGTVIKFDEFCNGFGIISYD